MVGRVLAIVCPGQGSQTPGFLVPGSRSPGRPAGGWLGAVAGLDLAAHGTTSDAETIRDTAIAQPLIVTAGLAALVALAPDVGGVADGWTSWPGTPSASSRRPRSPGCCPPSRPSCWSASAAGRWPPRAP